MGSADTSVDIPPKAAAVAQRYRRLERLATGAVALLIASMAVLAIFFLPLVPAVILAVILLTLYRLPILRSSGTLQLVSHADSEAVKTEFKSATPPVLPFQWGNADGIHPTTDGATYEFSYLFGLQSVTMSIKVRSVAADSGEQDGDLKLNVMAGGKPWGTYTVSIHESSTETVVIVEHASDRRFGFRRLPQWLVAEHYYTDALTAQGYTVAERDPSLSL